MVSKALSGESVTWYSDFVCNSFGPLTQSTIGTTCVEQVLTAPCDGIILQLWDVVADGSVEHLHF